MKRQIIISIGREYGSAGHEIAEKVAERFNLPIYDRKLLEQVAEKGRVGIEVLEKYDEKKRNKLLSRKVRGMSNSLEEAVAEMQFNYMREKAKTGESFVIVGRCSDVVLKGCEGLVTIFVTGNVETKRQRVMDKFNLSKAEAIAKMKRHDSTRKAYHNAHSKIAWGDSRGYDLCISSSALGIDKTVSVIENYIKTKFDLE